jgi:hypothetical protein
VGSAPGGTQTRRWGPAGSRPAGAAGRGLGQGRRLGLGARRRTAGGRRLRVRRAREAPWSLHGRRECGGGAHVLDPEPQQAGIIVVSLAAGHRLGGGLKGLQQLLLAARRWVRLLGPFHIPVHACMPAARVVDWSIVARAWVEPVPARVVVRMLCGTCTKRCRPRRWPAHLSQAGSGSSCASPIAARWFLCKGRTRLKIHAGSRAHNAQPVTPHTFVAPPARCLGSWMPLRVFSAARGPAYQPS